MHGNGLVRCGGRAGETGQQKRRHRAPVRPLHQAARPVARRLVRPLRHARHLQPLRPRLAGRGDRNRRTGRRVPRRRHPHLRQAHSGARRPRHLHDQQERRPALLHPWLAGVTGLTDALHPQPSRSICTSVFGVRGMPVPARGDRSGGALVLEVRAVLSRRGGTAGRTRRRGRSRDDLPVGSALHSVAGRGGPAVPTTRRQSLVDRRDLCPDRRPVALRPPRD